jgi:hypothetical protein
MSAVMRATAYDAQDNEIRAAVYEDIGAGPAVIFDGGGFTDPKQLRAYLAEIEVMADWLADAVASGQERPDA